MLELKANAYKEYGKAATLKLVLDAMPKIAAEVSAPLTNIDEIVMVGGSGKAGAVTLEVNKLLAELPVRFFEKTNVFKFSNRTGCPISSKFYCPKTYKLIIIHVSENFSLMTNMDFLTKN